MSERPDLPPVVELAVDAVVERSAGYGRPADNHACTAQMWSAYLSRRLGVDVALGARDVCWLNVLQKLSRDAHLPDDDNVIDTVGYAINVGLLDHPAAASDQAVTP